MFLPQHALPGILARATPKKLPVQCLLQGACCPRRSAEGDRKHETPQGSREALGKAGLFKGELQAPGFGNRTAEGTMPGSVPGVQEAPQNLPRLCEHGGSGSHHANMTWQAALVGRSALMSCQPAGITSLSALPWGEIHISGRRLHDRHATGGYCIDASCSPWLCATVPTHTAPSSLSTFSRLLRSITAVCQERLIFPFHLLSKANCVTAPFPFPHPVLA